MKSVNSENRIYNGKMSMLVILNLLCCIYISIWVMVPLFRSYTDKGIFRILFFLMSALWLITSCLINRKWIMKIIGVSIFGSVSLIIMIIYYIFNYGDMSFTQLVYPGMLFLFAFMGYYYTHMSNTGILKIIMSIITLLFIVTSCTTIIGLLENINVSRLMTSSSTSIEILKLLEKKNIAGFDFIYGTVIIMPGLIYSYKNMRKPKKLRRHKNLIKHKLLLLLVIILSLFLIALSNFTIAYLLLLLIGGLALLPNSKNIGLMIIWLSLLGVVFFPIILGVIILVLNIIRDITPSIMTQNKLENLVIILSGDMNLNQLSVRFSLQQNSITSFLTNPIIGVGAYYHNTLGPIGNHSQIFDDLGRYGMAGFVPLYYFINSMLRKSYNMLKDRVFKNAFIYSGLIYFILAFLNPVHVYGIMFTILFVLPIYLNYAQLCVSNVNK